MKSPFSPMSPRGGREGTLGQKREEEEALTTFIFPSFFLLFYPEGRNKGGFFFSSSARKVLIPGQVANFPSSFFPQGLFNANNFSDPNDFELFFIKMGR